MQKHESLPRLGDMLRIDVDAPHGRIVWEIPVRPIPGQTASYLADRIKELIALLEMRKRYAPSQGNMLNFQEQQALSSWQNAYEEALIQEGQLDRLLSRNRLAG